MPYTMIEDFAGGMDVRKSALTTRPNALRVLKNGFVNAGGEIEKRKTLTAFAVLPVGATKGLGFINDTAYVFGTAATAGATLPTYVGYQQLVCSGSSPALVRVLSARQFADKLYVIATFSDNTTRHFYNGAEVVNLRNKGDNATPHKTKMYVADGKNLRFSAINDPADTVGTGSGIIDITAQDVGSTKLLALEPYYSSFALFGQTSIQIWAMDTDPVNNQQVQVLGNIGLVAPYAVAQYGTGDVLFLSNTGVRSLRARDSSNSAVLNDVGSPIDPIIAAKRAVLTDTLVQQIKAMVDPLTGQFWLFWGNEAYVLSVYPASKVSAWCYHEFPITFDHIVLANSRFLARSGDQLFLYGSVPPSGNPFAVNAPVGTTSEYDSSELVAESAFLDMGQPATEKTWSGLDVACEGTWDVYANPEPRNPDAFVKIATITGATYPHERIAFDMRSTHIALKFVSTYAGPAKLSAVGLHYTLAEGK